jgi:tol-pal system protein YbgF
LALAGAAAYAPWVMWTGYFRTRSLALAAGALTFVSGCAHGAVADRQLASLEDGLNRDTAERDRVDPRLDPASIQAEEQAKLARSSAPAVPPPHVVALGANAPDGAESMQSGGETASALNGEDTTDTSPRPVIRVVGTGQVRRSGRGPNDRIEETLPDEPAEGTRVGPPIQANAPASSALDPNAKAAYDAALALVNAHDFDRALDAFAAFLVKWPDHPNADNAMYWRGECYFAKGELARAAEEFDGTVKRFPLGNKVPDCLLKLGICAQKLGNQAKSSAYFDRLAHDFPRSEAARRIPTDRTAHAGGRAGPEETP